MAKSKYFDSDVLVHLIERYQKDTTHIVLALEAVEGSCASMHLVWEFGALLPIGMNLLSGTRNRDFFTLNFDLRRKFEGSRFFTIPGTVPGIGDPLAVMLKTSKISEGSWRSRVEARAFPCYGDGVSEKRVILDPFPAKKAVCRMTAKYPLYSDLYKLAEDAVLERRRGLVQRECGGEAYECYKSV